MALEIVNEPIKPVSEHVAPFDPSPQVMRLESDNSSTNVVHPELEHTVINPAFQVRHVDPVEIPNPGAPIQPAANVETKVVKPKAKPAPKTSKPAETK